MKNWRNWVVVSALVAYVILFWIWKSYGFPIDVQTACKHAADGTQYDCAPEHIYLFVLREIGKAFSDSAFVTALATVLLAFITGGVVLVGYRQIQTSRAQLRAYVFMVAAKVNKFGFDQIPEVLVVIKNSGQTPAYDMVSWTGVLAQPFPFKGEFERPGPDFPIARGTLGPGAETHMIVPTKRAFTADETKMIRDGKAALFVFGEVTYRDAFKKTHATKYRYFFGGSAGARESGAMNMDLNGNDAD